MSEKQIAQEEAIKGMVDFWAGKFKLTREMTSEELRQRHIEEIWSDIYDEIYWAWKHKRILCRPEIDELIGDIEGILEKAKEIRRLEAESKAVGDAK